MEKALEGCEAGQVPVRLVRMTAPEWVQELLRSERERVLSGAEARVRRYEMAQDGEKGGEQNHLEEFLRRLKMRMSLERSLRASRIDKK